MLDANQCVYPNSDATKCNAAVSLVQCATSCFGVTTGRFGVGEGFGICAPATVTAHCNVRVCVAPCGLVNVSMMPPAGQGGCDAIAPNDGIPFASTDGYDAMPAGWPALLRKIENGGLPKVRSPIVALLSIDIVVVGDTAFAAFGRPL